MRLKLGTNDNNKEYNALEKNFRKLIRTSKFVHNIVCYSNGKISITKILHTMQTTNNTSQTTKMVSFVWWLRLTLLALAIVKLKQLRCLSICLDHISDVIAIRGATSWENLFLPYANNKSAYQPVHPRSLISTFNIRCLDSSISILSIEYISRP